MREDAIYPKRKMIQNLRWPFKKKFRNQSFIQANKQLVYTEAFLSSHLFKTCFEDVSIHNRHVYVSHVWALKTHPQRGTTWIKMIIKLITTNVIAWERNFQKLIPHLFMPSIFYYTNNFLIQVYSNVPALSLPILFSREEQEDEDEARAQGHWIKKEKEASHWA